MPSLVEIKNNYKTEGNSLGNAYEIIDSQEFSAFLDEASKNGWDITNDAEKKMLNALFIVIDKNENIDEKCSFYKVTTLESKMNWFNENIDLIDILDINWRDDHKKESDYLISFSSYIDKFSLQEKNQIEAEEKAEKEKQVQEKQQKQKEAQQKEEERLNKMSPFDRKKDVLKSEFTNDREGFVKKLFDLYVDSENNAEDLRAVQEVLKELNEDQWKSLRFTMFRDAVYECSHIVDTVDMFEQAYGQKFSAFDNKDELIMDANILSSKHNALNAYYEYIRFMPEEFKKETEKEYQDKQLKEFGKGYVKNYKMVINTTDQRLSEYGITLVEEPYLNIVVSEEGLAKAAEIRKHNKDIKSAENAYDKIDGFRSSLIQEIKDFRGRLALTQDDPEANFSAEKKPEGSTEYKHMTAALKNALAILENPKNTPDQINKALDDLWDKTYDYCRCKVGITGGPHTEKGQLRLEIAEDMRDHMNCYRKQWKEFSKNLKESYKKINGIDVNDKTSIDGYKSTKEQILAKAKTGYIVNEEDVAKKFAENNSFAVDKYLFINKLKKLNPFDVKNNKLYNPHVPGAGAAQLAKNYLTKKYIKTVQNVKLTPGELKECMARISDKEFEKEVKRISENAIFKDLIKKKPNKWFKEWNDIEKKAAKVADEMDESLFNMRRGYKSIEEYVLFKGGEGLVPVNNEKMYENLAEVMVKSMLSDPKYDAIRYTVAVKPESKDTLLASAREYLKKEKVLGNNMLIADKASIKKISEVLNSSSFKSGIIKKHAENEKRLVKEAKAANKTSSKTAVLTTNKTVNTNKIVNIK